MEDLIGNVADATFDQYFNAPASVVVYGIANCEGCAYMDGVLAEVAPEFQNKVRFGKGKMHVPGAAREMRQELDRFKRELGAEGGERSAAADRPRD